MSHEEVDALSVGSGVVQEGFEGVSCFVGCFFGVDFFHDMVPVFVVFFCGEFFAFVGNEVLAVLFQPCADEG